MPNTSPHVIQTQTEPIGPSPSGRGERLPVVSNSHSPFFLHPPPTFSAFLHTRHLCCRGWQVPEDAAEECRMASRDIAGSPQRTSNRENNRHQFLVWHTLAHKVLVRQLTKLWSPANNQWVSVLPTPTSSSPRLDPAQTSRPVQTPREPLAQAQGEVRVNPSLHLRHSPVVLDFRGRGGNSRYAAEN